MTLWHYKRKSDIEHLIFIYLKKTLISFSDSNGMTCLDKTIMTPSVIWIDY